MAGPVFTGSEYVFGVARFTVDGYVDNSFSGDGKTTYNFTASTTDWATVVVVQNGARIIVGGFTNDDFALVALTLSGGVDASFGGAGQAVINMGGYDYLYAMTLAPDNSIYAAGVRDIGGNGDFAILRLDANGFITVCPVGGCPPARVFRDWGASYGVALGIDVRNDGHIVVAGNVGGVYMGWAEYSTYGTTYLSTGLADFPGNDEATAVKFVGTDKVVLAGYHYYANDRNLALARFETTPSAAVDVGDRPWVGGPAARFQTAIPNPFTRQMTLAFELPQAQPVRIVLYDAAGRAVRTLADETLPAGRHQRIWDGADGDGRPVAAGVYFAQLVAGTDQDRKKVVVLR